MTTTIDNLDNICDLIKERRNLSTGTMTKYRQKLKKFHIAVCGDIPFTGLEFLKDNQNELIDEIKKESSHVARSSYSCLLGALTNSDKTAIDESYNNVVIELRTHMELKNQEYVDKKTEQAHSPSQVTNWVSLDRLKKYQRKVMRDATEIERRSKSAGTPLTWNEFKVIQKATIVTLYINYRKANENYPTWYKIFNSDLPNITNDSHIAPKRLEYGDLYVTKNAEFDTEKNTLFVSGSLSRHKRLWFAEQKNKEPHYEYVNNILNKALNIQMWAIRQYYKGSMLAVENDENDKLLIMKNGNRMSKGNLSSWIGKAFANLGVDMTANTLRHIAAEEQGVEPEDKKLLKEQLNGMNHSQGVHDLVYST